jgi:hypothetical protein
MVTICLHCGKYIFDGQNVNEYKRMTLAEYVDGVCRRNIRTNQTTKQLILELDLSTLWMVSKSECELCGAPHSIFTLKHDCRAVELVRFFFSGTIKPSEKDVQFINHYRRDFFAG